MAQKQTAVVDVAEGRAGSTLQARVATRVANWRLRLAKAVRRAELRHYEWGDRRFSMFERFRFSRHRAQKLHRAHDLVASIAYGVVEISILGFGALLGKKLGGGNNRLSSEGDERE